MLTPAAPIDLRTADTLPGQPARLASAPEDAPGLCGLLLDDRYEVGNKLGAGGMGEVYEALQLSTMRPVALKVLRPELATDITAVKRFFREARIASRLKHANTVAVFDFGQSQAGLLYYAMELLEGCSLSWVIDNEGPLEAERAARICRQVCWSLAEAHEQGAIHRDLKPDNIHLVDQHGHPEFVKVLDFGIARTTEDRGTRLTRTGMICGTAEYLAPEAAQGDDLDVRADIYALGVVLHEMLSGKTPFDGDTPLAVLMAHATCEVPELPPHTPRPLANLVTRMMAKDPADRPSSVLAVEIELSAIIAAENPLWAESKITIEVPVVPDEPLPGERTQPGARRRPWVLGGVLLGALLTAAVHLVAPAEPPAATAAPAVEAFGPAVTPTVEHQRTRALPRRYPELWPVGQERRPLETTIAPVQVTVDVTEGQAVVWEGGQRLGETPLVVDVAIKPGVRTLTLKRPGFRAAPVTARADGVPVVVELRRQGRARRSDRGLKRW